RLGSGNWDKVKRRVKKAMRDMAAELLKLYAQRKARPGHAFTGFSPWQREFEESFEYEETPDQAAAIAEVMADMSADTPMDRLICGDVGYGKTEVAMRAAMRAVLDGVPAPLRPLPGARGDGLALPARAGDQEGAGRSGHGRRGHPHRDAPRA